MSFQSPAFLRRRALLVLAAAVLFSSGCDRLGWTGSQPAEAAFRGIDITGADYARELTLPDQNGQLRTLADFKGKVTVVFFGFTQCPDVCPSTMVELAQVKKALGADGDRLQGVFVSIDPERDTPQLLKAYMASFDPSFVALRGTPEQTAAVAKEFKVYYAKSPSKTTPGNYTMDHTAGSYVLDAQGRVRLFVRYGSGADALKTDLKTLLDEGRVAG